MNTAISLLILEREKKEIQQALTRFAVLLR